MPKINVVFSPRAEWQSFDCLYCGEQASVQAEAKSKKKGYSTAIRSCENPNCKTQAKEAAKRIVEALDKS